MNQDKILTREEVIKLGLDEVQVITADMLAGYTNIGNYAFNYCFNLISVVIPDSVTRIGGFAFYKCSNLTSVAIPNSVTSIGDGAFYLCSGLTSVTIPNSVTSIGNSAFFGCSGLTSVTIGNSVTSIGNYAFGWCTGLTSIEIPNSVTSIGDRAFASCTSLTSVTIPNSVTSIGWLAFYLCTGLTSVTIDDVEYKKHWTIKSKCKAYKAFNADMTCRDFQYEEGKTYEIDGTIKLCEHGFHACLNLLDVFNYYSGKLGKKIHIHEVELEGISVESCDDSKVVASKITIGKRIL